MTCRLQCVLPDFTGLFVVSEWKRIGRIFLIIIFLSSFHLGARVAKNCGSGAKYFSSIDECIPLAKLALPEFLQSITYSIACTATSDIRTVDDLEGLRYCGSIESGLNIMVSDLTADYSALYDISSVQGLKERFNFEVMSVICFFVGALTVANSSMSSMRSFAHLVSIATNGQRATVKGSNYEVVVSGLFYCPSLVILEVIICYYICRQRCAARSWKPVAHPRYAG